MQTEMMDDVRPPSLPANDGAASNARRIEGLPGTTLRPLSEQVEGITLKRGTLAITNKVVKSSEDPFRNLSDDILEHILAKLPLFSLKAAKKVCKRWASVTNTPYFDILNNKLNPKPRLVRYGFSPRGPSESTSFAYDVENNAWVTLPGLQFLPCNHDTIPPTWFQDEIFSGVSEVVFAIVGPDKDRLLYKLTSSASSAESFGETWYETPVMTFPRADPVVSVALGAGRGHKVVVAGGGSDVPARHRAVEVFDSEIGTWESYGDLPKEFKRANCWMSMSGVVCDNKFYVSNLRYYDTADVRVHCLDLYTKQWASIQLEIPDDLIYHDIMAIGTTVVVAGFYVHSAHQHLTVKLWKVDLKTGSEIQIGLMPSELAALIEQPLGVVPFEVVVNENLVYFILEDVNIVVGEVSLEECKTCWRLLPAHPATQGFIPYDRFITFFASISSA